MQEHRGLTGNKLSYALLTQYICHMTFLLELLSEFCFCYCFSISRGVDTLVNCRKKKDVQGGFVRSVLLECFCDGFTCWDNILLVGGAMVE